MKRHATIVTLALGLSFGAVCRAQGKVELLKEEPPKGSVPFDKIVYVDDRSCPKGDVKEIVGGNQEKSIPRRVRCVKRPG